MDAVIVKGGHNANAYVYDPPAESTGDTVYTPRTIHNGGPAELSHIYFCWDGETVVPKPLTATKTANRQLRPHDHLGPHQDRRYGQPQRRSGRLVQFHLEGERDEERAALGNYNVTGEIKIDNPNGFAVDFSVTDKLDEAQWPTWTAIRTRLATKPLEPCLPTAALRVPTVPHPRTRTQR